MALSSGPIRTIRTQLDTKMWTVVEIWSCDNSELATNEALAWTRIPAGYSGRFAPRAVEVVGTKGGMGGTRARIIAKYRTLSNDELMLRFPPKGVVYVQGAARSQRIWVDRNGNTIQGIDDSDLTGRTSWKIFDGPDTVVKPETTFRVHAVVNSKSIWVDQYVTRLGSVNNSFMTQLGQYGASPGELLLTQMDAAPYKYNKATYFVDYYFAWTGERGKTWNQITKSRRMIKVVQTLPVFDTDGVDTETTKQSPGLMPTTVTRTAQIGESFSFTFIDGICQW